MHVLKWACPLQIPKQQAAILFFGYTKILHMLVLIVSTSLAGAVVLPRYGGLNYARGINEVLKNKKCHVA